VIRFYGALGKPLSGNRLTFVLRIVNQQPQGPIYGTGIFEHQGL
jgi:hypothetical protein